ncbi:2Fe-2S iron-sulfur cluster-binding protein [Pseudoduganella namucuonensis]|uniref:Ferredoxin, 2Fe-2S n=1 Tax=Pseudoduganella namucuonensis TaxID=1035707 RepID=A0A1I7KYV5_9BURK|nr:2Fe-2S iron-sulfur cluster-binding protein [Pseudoduganella namucuonensis]SFV02585.1 ferredoxin, 2Fe-2S [Pseudoduganella namucuonensis]
MAKVIYITAAGERTELEVDAGVNLMQAAVSNGIYEIVGDCGGSASCATCHVYLDPAFAQLVPAPGPREEQMMGSTASPRTAESRLSCQIVMEEQLDGIILRIPETQW